MSTISAALVAAILFGGMLLAAEVGLQIGRRRLAAEGHPSKIGLGAIEGAVFGLMGLLIAFAFLGGMRLWETGPVMDRSRLTSPGENGTDHADAGDRPPARRRRAAKSDQPEDQQ